MWTHLNDVAQVAARRAEGELAKVRHLILLRSMDLQVVGFPHVAVVRFVAGCNKGERALFSFNLLGAQAASLSIKSITLP